SKRRYRRVLGDCTQIQLDPNCHVDTRRDNRATQGVATEVEEIVVSADIRQPKNLRPDIEKHHPRLGSWLITLVALTMRKGISAERLSIDLVTFVVGKTIQEHDL